MKKISISPKSADFSTDLYFGEGILESALTSCFTQRKGKRVIVTDPWIAELYALSLAKQIGAELLVVPRGERAKTQEVAFDLLERLFRMGANKETTLIAMGGGSITDLGGFVASIYMRGIASVFIPTTLLGCVDAAIGGKTAIDLPFGKNLLGTIYPPKVVFIDLDLLKTLPETEWRHGLAEVLKMGLVQDPSICQAADTRDQTVILKAIQGKVSIVEKDPFEQSIRRILNFGHTVAHALETVSRYEMPHGEAVALGCLVESYLSWQLGYLSQADFHQIEMLYEPFPRKLPRNYTRDSFLQALDRDKKKVGKEVRFVLIDRIGHAIPFEGAYVREVAFDAMRSTWDWMEKMAR